MPAKPQSERLADYLRLQIESGELAPGDKLPSTSELCKEHGIAVSVVRQAILKLRTEALIEGVQGVGVFVVER